MKPIQKIFILALLLALTIPAIPLAAAQRVIVHQVRSGDTLYELARTYHTTVTQIQKDNHVWDSRLLQIGTRLRIRTADKKPSGIQQVGVRKVLHATLTAYTAGVESTGKTKSHPAYGITSSGARVKEGRTIAVDPRVIPIGATVYIEGVGIRVAEDTGSAIRGSKIDVYMDDVREAIRFGVKHNRKVYVLRTTS